MQSSLRHIERHKHKDKSCFVLVSILILVFHSDVFHSKHMLDFGMLFLSMGACFFLGLSVLFVRGRTDCHLVGVVCFIYRRTVLALWCWPNLSLLEIRLKSLCSLQHFTILVMEITLFTMFPSPRSLSL